MRHILTAIFVLGFSFSSQAIHCTGEYEGNDEKGDFIKRSQELSLEFKNNGVEQYTADIGDFHYFVKGYKDTNRYLLMITLGPDYTQGVTASMAWDYDNTMRLARVDGVDVFRLICTK